MGHLPFVVREVLLTHCRAVRFEAGQHLLRQGEHGGHAVVILDGVAKIRVVDRSGFAAVLAIRQSGDIVGELGALTGEPRTASVVAATPLWGGLIGGPELGGVMAGNPVTARELIRAQGRRLDWANRRRVDFVARPARLKIARALSELVQQFDRADSTAQIHLSQHELATLVGVGLNTAERALSRLAGMGLVVRRYRMITVPDPDRLHAFAESDP